MSALRATLLVLFALGGAAALGAGVVYLVEGRGSGEPSEEPAAGPSREGFAGERVPVGPVPVGTEGPDAVAAAARARFVELNNAGAAALDAGELDRAVELLTEALAGEPDNAVFRRNLAEALARIARRDWEAGDREGALAVLERAIELAPGREDLVDRLARLSDEADIERDFWRDHSMNFELSYDGARSELLHGSQPVLDALEAAYADLRDVYGIDPVFSGRPKLRVVLYRPENFDRLTGMGDWAGGVFDGTIRVPVQDLSAEGERLSEVLRHELSHAFTLEAGGASVPGWLNEGIAQYVEPGAAADVARARESLRGQALFPLERLGGSLASWEDTDAIRLAYRQSLSLVAWLVGRYGERVVFDMVAGCAEGRTPAETFEDRTLVPLATALADLAADTGAEIGE